MSLSYESSGVRYDQLDAFKRACQQAARTTAGALAAHGWREPAAVRGESAYLIEADDHYLAHVEEGLGTKNLVADAVQAATRPVLLPGDRHRHRGHHRERPRDLRRAADVRGHACRGGRFRLVRRPGACAESRGRICRGLPAGRGGVGRGRDARSARDRGTRGHRPGGLGRGPDRAENRCASRATCATATPSCSSPPRACRPTGSRSAARSPRSCRRATARRSATAATLRRGAARAVGDLRGLRARVPAARPQAQLRWRTSPATAGASSCGWRSPSSTRSRRCARRRRCFGSCMQAGPIDLREAYATFNMGDRFRGLRGAAARRRRRRRGPGRRLRRLGGGSRARRRQPQSRGGAAARTHLRGRHPAGAVRELSHRRARREQRAAGNCRKSDSFSVSTGAAVLGCVFKLGFVANR